MAEKTWQQINAEHVLFIVDANHKVEESWLLRWLNEGKARAQFTGKMSHCVVPIANDPEDIQTDDLQTMLDVEDDTLVVPVRIVWKTAIDKIHTKPRFRDLLRGNPRRPNQRQAQKILDQSPGLAQCIMAQPATMQDLRARYEVRQKRAMISKNLADYVAEQASLALEVGERRVRGSRYKVARQVSKQVRATDAYQRGLQEISKQTGESEQALRERALPYFKELVALPHNFWQDVAGSFNRWVISLGYENELVIDTKKLERYRSIVRDHPTALLWTHKTHMDGITMQSILFEHDFPPAHTMGGINMAFAGVGFLARRSGAIFIRRSFQNNALYKLVLRQYLGFLLEKRFPLTWSFEGTRSRVGKLMPPRYGMLKYVLDAMQETNVDQLHILPVAINYDMNNDVKDYAAEQSGGIKRPESLSWFISYLRRMRQPLGRIYVDFGEPVVVDKKRINDDSLAIQKVAFKVGVEANRVTPITLTALMSMSLLGASPRAQTINELQDNMDSLREWAKHRDITFTSDFDDENQDHMLELVDAMVNIELINRYDEGPETIYAVAEDQHTMASYYRNTIVHHFVPKAIAELAILEAMSHPDDPLAAFWNEANRLKDMFKFEFFYAPTDEFQAEIKAELDFYDPDWQEKIRQPRFLSSFINQLKPLIGHASLKPYIEAYRIMADCFARLEADQTLDEKSAVTLAYKYGRQAYLQRRISSRASIGQILFKNAYKVLEGYDVVAVGGEDTVAKRKAISKDFRLLAHRIEKLRILAMPDDID